MPSISLNVTSQQIAQIKHTTAYIAQSSLSNRISK